MLEHLGFCATASVGMVLALNNAEPVFGGGFHFVQELSRDIIGLELISANLIGIRDA